MKPKLFIGSSAEALFIAKALQKILGADFEVKVWDAAYQSGYFFLETLLKELFLTDFALFIIAPDDKINKRGQDAFTTRDNVIFELGMFIGALGLRKANYIVVEIMQDGKWISPTVPSDLGGIKTTRIRLEADSGGKPLENETNQNAINAAAKNLSGLFLAKAGLSLDLLPSTSLAIGYYRNFILQACKELSQRTAFKVDDITYDLRNDAFDFYIIIPDQGKEASHEAYQKFVRNNNLKLVEIKTDIKGARPFPFFIQSDLKDGRLQLFDYPTTLRASSDAIDLVMPFGTPKEEIEQLELKEITNFKNTLQFLLGQPDSAGFRKNIHLVTASEINGTN